LVLFCFKHTSTFISIFCTFLLKQYELEWCSKKTYCKQTPLFKFKGTMTKWPVDKQSHIAQYETRNSTRRNRHSHKQTQFNKDINEFAESKCNICLNAHCEVIYFSETVFKQKRNTVATMFESFIVESR